MKQSTCTRGKFSIIAAVVLLGSITLYSCNDDSKNTEVTTTADTSKLVTPPVVMQDTVMMKDTMPKIDTEKTEQAPPPRPR